MEITWEVEDGCVGKSRPHHLTIPNEELEDYETEEEKQEFIEEYVQNEFEQTISFSIISQKES